MPMFNVAGNVSVKVGEKKFVTFPVEGKIVASSVNEAASSESMRVLLMQAAKEHDKKSTGKDILGPRFCPEKGMTRGLTFTASKYLQAHESLPGWFLVRFLPGLTLGITFAIYNADNIPGTSVLANRRGWRTRITSFKATDYSMSIDNNIKSARLSFAYLTLSADEDSVLAIFRQVKRNKQEAKQAILDSVRASLDNMGVGVNRGSGASYPMKTLVAKIVAENSSFQDEHSGATIASEVEWALRELGGEVSYAGRKATITFRLEKRSQGGRLLFFCLPRYDLCNIYCNNYTRITLSLATDLRSQSPITSFKATPYYMTTENLSAVQSVLSALCLIVAEQKPQNIENFLVRRGTFATIDFPLSYTRFEQRAEEYARSCAVVKEDILSRTDAYLSTGKRVKLADIVSGIVNGMGVEPTDPDLQAKKEYVEMMVLKSTSDNDVENRYHWVKRGKNAGLCAWKFKD